MKTVHKIAALVFVSVLNNGNAFAQFEGNSNTFLGTDTGANTVGDDDSATFVGYKAGENNTIGSGNTFMGWIAGHSNTQGSENTFVGANAGFSNLTGSANSFVGDNAGYSNVDGSHNTYFGYYAGNRATEGSDNTFIGSGAGNTNTEASGNTFVGRSAGNSNTTGHSNAFLGYQAGYQNTIGHRNSFLGYQAGSSNIAGWANTFVGERAGSANTNGQRNTFVGDRAGHQNTTGYMNTFLGAWAGQTNSEGHFNTFVGQGAGIYRRGGSSNTLIGFAAGYAHPAKWDEGDHNTFLGYRAGENSVSGHGNTFLGSRSGQSNSAGDYNVFVGNEAGYFEGGSNKLYVDSSNTSSPLIHGDFVSDELTLNGDVHVTGTLTKTSGSFVQPHPSDPAKELVYAFFEGPEHAVFLRGKAKLVNGRAVIETPEHFRLVAGRDEHITVQLTPRSADTFGLAAVKVTKERIRVRELRGATNTYEFDYFITAKRGGFEAHAPIQPNTHFTADQKRPEDFEAAFGKVDDLSDKAVRKLLVANGTLTSAGKLNRETAARLGWKLREVESSSESESPIPGPEHAK